MSIIKLTRLLADLLEATQTPDPRVEAVMQKLEGSAGAALMVGLIILGVVLAIITFILGVIKDLKSKTTQGYGGVLWLAVLSGLCFIGSVGVFIARSMLAVFFDD